MVKLREILEKLSPDLKYGDNIMNIELGDVNFDTFNEIDDFFYIFSNSKDSNIKLRLKDDFPFRVVLLKRNDDVVTGKTWNGLECHEWTEDNKEIIKKLWK